MVPSPNGSPAYRGSDASGLPGCGLMDIGRRPPGQQAIAERPTGSAWYVNRQLPHGLAVADRAQAREADQRGQDIGADQELGRVETFLVVIVDVPERPPARD